MAWELCRCGQVKNHPDFPHDEEKCKAINLVRVAEYQKQLIDDRKASKERRCNSDFLSKMQKLYAIEEVKGDLDYAIRRLTELWGENEAKKFISIVAERTWGTGLEFTSKRRRNTQRTTR